MPKTGKGWKSPVEHLYSAEAEKAVLGCMMAQPAEVIDEVVLTLQADDFFVPAHQIIFSALLDLYEHSSAIDVMTVDNYLRNTKEAERVGSPGILAELLVGFATHLNVGSYIMIVLGKSELRKLQRACEDIQKDITELPDSIPAVLDRAESMIFDRVSANRFNKEKPFSEMLTDVTTQAIEWSRQGGGLRGMPTGFKKLDNILGGWRGDQMIVIGASMGVGKSALSLTFARHLLNHGYPGGMFSLEMSETQTCYRILSGEAVIGSRDLFQGTLSEERRLALRGKSEEIKDWPFYLDCTQGLDITQIRCRARRWKRKYGIKFLVIDFVQLVRSKRADESKTAEVAEVSRHIKEMAGELDITVFALSQLNCPSDEVPTKTSLKDSKAIAESADVILLMHQDNASQDGSLRTYNLHIAKQREGQDDYRFQIEYQAWRTHFRDLER